jgi:hypothetical protein
MEWIDRTGNVANQAQIRLPNIANPTERDLIGHGWRPFVRASIPDGHVAIAGSKTLQESVGTVYETIETEPIEIHAARRDAANQSRIEGLAEAHGGKVAALAMALAQFGLAIPISEAEAMSRIEGMIARKEMTMQQFVLLGTLGAAWEACKAVMQPEDVPGVFDQIKEGLI